MARAEIRGRVNLQGASITTEHGSPSLTLDLARIEGGLVCATLTSIGELRLLGATIKGQVDFSDGSFENPRGVAIAMDGSSISGGLFLQYAHLSGTVRLVGAEVNGLVSFTGTDFENPGDRSTTERKGFSPDVAIRAYMTPSYKRSLREVETPTRVDFSPTAAVDELGLALSMEQARIRGPLFLDCGSVQGLMNLSHCSVDVLVQYDPLTAPPTIIDGLAFPRIHPGPGPDAPFVKVGDRLAWLAQAPTGYRPGAYAALASAYDRAGHEAAARQVRIASQNARYADAPSPRRAWGWLQKWTVGYGYRPARAIVWLLGYWVLGSALLWWADRRDESLFAVTGGRPWTPASYFLDLLLPFVDLPQTKEVTASGWGQWLVVGLVAFGFVIFTASVAGISGAVARRT